MVEDNTTLPGAGRLFAAAWRLPFQHFGALLRFGLLPLLIASIAWPPNYSIDVDGSRIGLTDGVYTLRDLFGFLIALPFAAAFAASWLRLAVSGEEAEMGRPPIALDRRTWRVAWAFLRLLFVALGVLVLVTIGLFAVFGHYRNGTLAFSIGGDLQRDGLAALPGFFGVLLGLVAFAWFMLRFAMVIPAAAIGERDIDLRSSWRMTQPLQGRQLAALVLLTLALCVIGVAALFGVVAIAPMLGPTAAFYLGIPVILTLLVFAHAFWAGLLGAAYRALAAPLDVAVAGVFS